MWIQQITRKLLLLWLPSWQPAHHRLSSSPRFSPLSLLNMPIMESLTGLLDSHLIKGPGLSLHSVKHQPCLSSHLSHLYHRLGGLHRCSSLDHHLDFLEVSSHHPHHCSSCMHLYHLPCRSSRQVSSSMGRLQGSSHHQVSLTRCNLPRLRKGNSNLYWFCCGRDRLNDPSRIKMCILCCCFLLVYCVEFNL
jgi:hypothetical protein